MELTPDPQPRPSKVTRIAVEPDPIDDLVSIVERHRQNRRTI
jgi:hypothetical protein